MIADALLWNEACTAAIAIELTLSLTLIARLADLKLSNSSLWKITDSASRAIFKERGKKKTLLFHVKNVFI
jgi:hypothetical protein